jgi:hypothetical protein
MDKMKRSMPATTEKDSLFSDSMMQWLDEGDRLHEDPRHASFAGDAASARRPWLLWIGAVWVIAFVVGGRFALQRFGTGQPASSASSTVAALVGSPRLAVSPPPAAPAISPTVTAVPPPAAAPVSAVSAPAAAPTEPTGERRVIAKAKPSVQDVVVPPKAVQAAAVEPLAKVSTTEATVHGFAAGDAPAAVTAPVAAGVETATAPVVQDFDSLLARCHDATTRGRWGAARTACNAAQQARPDSPDVLTRLAEIALNRGQGRAAMRLASAALAADPAFADAYVIVGSVEQGANRNLEARAAYSRYLKLAPSGRYASDLRAILATL